MINQKINLEILVNTFRTKGKGLIGYRLLNKLIKSNDIEQLKLLLRDHRIKPIYSFEEVKKRDCVDFYLDYCSIIAVAQIAGYVSKQLPNNIKREIEFILSNEQVVKYYQQYYPLLLPEVLLKESISTQNIESNSNSFLLFERFLILNKYIKSDADVNLFLWLLDDGIVAGNSIKTFIEFFKENKSFIKNNKLQQKIYIEALRGYVKYMQFLEDYKKLLEDTEEIKLLKSAFWCYQSYWFNKLKDKLGVVINDSIENMNFYYKDSEINLSLVNEKSADYNFLKLKNETNQNLNYLFNRDNGTHLKSIL